MILPQFFLFWVGCLLQQAEFIFFDRKNNPHFWREIEKNAGTESGAWEKISI